MLRTKTPSLTDCLTKCTRYRKQKKGEVKFSYELDDTAVVVEVYAQLALLAADCSFDPYKRDDFLFVVFLIRRAPALRKSIFSRMNYVEIFNILSKVSPTEHEKIGLSLSLLINTMNSVDLSNTVGLICDIRAHGFDEWLAFVAKKINDGRAPNSVNNSNPWLWILDVATTSFWSAPYGKQELELVEMLNY